VSHKIVTESEGEFLVITRDDRTDQQIKIGPNHYPAIMGIRERPIYMSFNGSSTSITVEDAQAAIKHLAQIIRQVELAQEEEKRKLPTEQGVYRYKSTDYVYVLDWHGVWHYGEEERSADAMRQRIGSDSGLHLVRLVPEVTV